MLEPQATEEGGLPDTAIEQDFPVLDVWLILERDPLITAVLNQQGPICVVKLADVAIRRDGGSDFMVRENAELAISLQRRPTAAARVGPEVEEETRAVLEGTAEVTVLAQIGLRVEDFREDPGVLEEVVSVSGSTGLYAKGPSAASQGTRYLELTTVPVGKRVRAAIGVDLC